MTKDLVIVESPAKARTVGRFLGSGYEVKASMGHVRDLPENDFGVDAENGFKPTYVRVSGRDKVVSEIKKAAKGAAQIYLATDPDREGEAISWHLVEAAGLAKPFSWAAVWKDRIEGTLAFRSVQPTITSGLLRWESFEVHPAPMPPQ